LNRKKMQKPNWCSNQVCLAGPPVKIEELVQYVKGENEIDMDFGHTWNGENVNGQLLTFRKIVVPPRGNWDPAWCLANWGVKWDACEVNGFNHGNYIIYRFDTAWGPPFPIADKLKTEFPDVYVSWYFHEPQNELAGYIKCEPKKYKEKKIAL